MNSYQQDAPDKDLEPGKDLKSYIESRIELFSISIAEKVASTISDSIQKVFGIIFLSVGALFLWASLGLFLGELLGSNALGFLLASLPLLLIGLVLYNRSSDSLEGKIQSDIIKKINPKTITGISDGEKKNSAPRNRKSETKHSE